MEISITICLVGILATVIYYGEKKKAQDALLSKLQRDLQILNEKLRKTLSYENEKEENIEKVASSTEDLKREKIKLESPTSASLDKKEKQKEQETQETRT